MSLLRVDRLPASRAIATMLPEFRRDNAHLRKRCLACGAPATLLRRNDMQSGYSLKRSMRIGSLAIVVCALGCGSSGPSPSNGNAGGTGAGGGQGNLAGAGGNAGVGGGTNAAGQASLGLPFIREYNDRQTPT